MPAASLYQGEPPCTQGRLQALQFPQPLQCTMQALVQSKAVETALSQIMSLPEPLAMEQRLATFLEALMHGQANRPAKLASAFVGIAAAAKKDGSQASYTNVLLISVLLWENCSFCLYLRSCQKAYAPPNTSVCQG